MPRSHLQYKVFSYRFHTVSSRSHSNRFKYHTTYGYERLEELRLQAWEVKAIFFLLRLGCRLFIFGFYGDLLTDSTPCLARIQIHDPLVESPTS
jgi:hypothetical protein